MMQLSVLLPPAIKRVPTQTKYMRIEWLWLRANASYVLHLFSPTAENARMAGLPDPH